LATDFGVAFFSSWFTLGGKPKAPQHYLVIIFKVGGVRWL